MHVQDHYNARKQQNADERKESPIFRLRLFNNWIKAMLIQKALRILTPKQPSIKVLDLACGKGGDLTKYRRNDNIKHYIGVDIAEVSVEHARERFMAGRFPFKAEFYSGDAFGQPLSAVIANKTVSVHLVSCQFALHYAFKTEAMVRQAVHNIACALMHDGIFICTVPNKQVICDRVDKGEASNAHYRITLTDPKNTTSEETIYGREYKFWLSDAIDDCPEYLVDKEAFLAVCQEHGLELMECQNFKDVYCEQGPDFYDLLKVMGVISCSDDGDDVGKRDYRLQMTRDEMTIAELYDIYMFCKRQPE